MLDTPLGQWLLVVGLFVLGSLLGSFANVVIYRLPLGKSLLWPGSQCPACGHPIRWYDNVPVFGWLLLNGHCRDCRIPISSRYPLVEALFGMLLATLGWLEIVDARSSLHEQPFAAANSYPSSNGFLTGYHMLLLGTLVVAALIQSDGRRIPRRLLIFTLLCGLVLPLAAGALRPVPLGDELPPILRAQPALRALLEGLAGVGAGMLLGCLAWPSIAQSRAHSDSGAMLLAMATVGALLGWQAACGIAIILAVCDLLAAPVALAWPKARRIGWCVWLAVATAVWLACWPTNWLTCWSTGALAAARLHFGRLDPLIAAGAVVALVSIVDWQVRRGRLAAGD